MRIPGRTVDAVKSSLAAGAYGGEQRDTVVRIRDIEIDARDVREITGVLVSLEEEMPSVIVTGRRSPGIVIEHEIGVLVRFRSRTGRVTQKPEAADDTRRIFEEIDSLGNEAERKSRRNDRVRSSGARVRIGNATVQFCLEDLEIG